MSGQGNTFFMNEAVLQCDNLEDFKEEIYSNLESQKQRWMDKINEILKSNDYSQAELARVCKVSKATVLKWVRGSIPQSRDMMIRIGFAAKYNLKEMNAFIRKYGRYPELYPKCAEDSVYIFVLNSDVFEHTYETCERIFAKIAESICTDVNIEGENVETLLVMDKLLSLKEMDELKVFIKDNASIFKSSFENFYDYVKEYVRRNNKSYIDEGNIDNINLLADTLEWSSSLRKCVYLIYKKEWFPIRSKVISLGVHLNMNYEEINKMLILAKMEPLYVRNPIESILIYALVDADLEDMIFEGTDDLFNHVVDIFEEMGCKDEAIELLV